MNEFIENSKENICKIYQISLHNIVNTYIIYIITKRRRNWYHIPFLIFIALEQFESDNKEVLRIITPHVRKKKITLWNFRPVGKSVQSLFHMTLHTFLRFASLIHQYTLTLQRTQSIAYHFTSEKIKLNNGYKVWARIF